MVHFGEYAGLFAASFLAATVLPFQPEVILFGMLLTEHYLTWALVLLSSAGNILDRASTGSSAGFWPASRTAHGFRQAREERPCRSLVSPRYGRWSLLLSWAPIVADPLTIVAG